MSRNIVARMIHGVLGKRGLLHNLHASNNKISRAGFICLRYALDIRPRTHRIIRSFVYAWCMRIRNEEKKKKSKVKGHILDVNLKMIYRRNRYQLTFPIAA